MKDSRKSPASAGDAETTGQVREPLQSVLETCAGCDICRKECAFLRKYGTPKEIADRYDPSRKEDRGMPFECSLCGLCTAVCPLGVDPAGLFLAMRRETVRLGGGIFPEHTPLTDYEARGTSRRYTYYGFPEACDTVFFPGCTLSGTRSEKVIRAYQHLKERIPSLGIVLDCCMKPSHDLGREDHAMSMFAEMRAYLTEQGITRVIVACPNCYRMFARYGGGPSITTLYEILTIEGIERRDRVAGTVAVHDPCSIRFEEEIHKAVRDLLRNRGYGTEDMAHTGTRTLCCGEGGAVDFLAPDLADNWTKLRYDETARRQMVTYCAGCAARLGEITPTLHVLDILWDGETDRYGRVKVTKPPLTYWKRLKLKRWFKEHVPAKVTRERTFTGMNKQKKGERGFLPLFVQIT